MLAASLHDFHYAPLVVAGTIVTMAISCFIFFWPLYSTHDAMNRAKGAELSRVAYLFRQEYAQLPQQGSQSGDDIAPRLGRMAKLAELHSAVKAMPVWPFDLKTIGKFGLLVSTPAFTAFLQSRLPTKFVEGINAALHELAK